MTLTLLTSNINAEQTSIFKKCELTMDSVVISAQIVTIESIQLL